MSYKVVFSLCLNLSHGLSTFLWSSWNWQEMSIFQFCCLSFIHITTMFNPFQLDLHEETFLVPNSGISKKFKVWDFVLQCISTDKAMAAFLKCINMVNQGYTKGVYLPMRIIQYIREILFEKIQQFSSFFRIFFLNVNFVLFRIVCFLLRRF